VDEAAGAYRAAWQRDRGSATSAYLFLRSASAADASPDLSAAMEALSSAVTRSLDAAVPPARFLVVGLLDDGSVPSPAFPRALYATAFDLLRQSKYEDAIAKFRDAAAVDPLVTDSALRRAAVTEAADAVRRDRADSAVPALAAAVAQAAGSSELHRMLGTAYWAARRYGEALEQFRTAVGLAPRDERSRLAMADVLQAMGDASGARQALLDTLRAIPESQQAQWKLGRLHQSVGDERGALDAFDAAWKHPPLAGAGHLLAAIGRLHHARLDLESAVDVYARRVRGTPNDVAAHLDLADVLRADDRLSEASREALVAALLDPGSARAFATIGQLLVSGGRDAEGERMLRQAVTLDPAHLEAHYGLSRVLLRLGRAEDAARELEVYRQLQAKAMEDERRRFRDNQQRLEETLRAGESKEPVR
jgi:tetratricopeptide (TPR) repeat protein